MLIAVEPSKPAPIPGVALVVVALGSLQTPLWADEVAAGVVFAAACAALPPMRDMMINVDATTDATIEPNVTAPNSNS